MEGGEKLARLHHATVGFYLLQHSSELNHNL